jgi:hypothetical protein
MKEFTISVPDELGEAIENAAVEQGKTVDEVFADAAKREIGRRWMDKLKREGDARRGNMTDDEVDAIVNKAIQEDRQEQRSR